MRKKNAWALMPILIFITLYLGLGIIFECGLNIEMGFYQIPVVPIFLIAVFCAFLLNKNYTFDEKMEFFGTGVGNKNISIMILIFLVSGLFVGIVGRGSAESVAYFMLDIIPAKYTILVLFIISAFVSTAMGTSVGTITLVAPIAIAYAQGSGFNPALCLGTVVGGAMFGDNLSFISDTTIAACNGQGCRMKDKFLENLNIAVPASLITLLLLALLFTKPSATAIQGEYDLMLIIPYVLVLIGGIAGLNVFTTLLIGIVTGIGIVLGTGACTFTDLVGNIGSGVSGMFETAMVAILVSGMCELIREDGGFAWLLDLTKKIFKGKKAGQIGMGLLVCAIDASTANNTVAIVIANPIVEEMRKEYGITGKRAASILDTFSCVMQGIIPYGAQILVACSAAATLGCELSTISVIPYLIYPFVLLVCSVLYIIFFTGKEPKEKNKDKTTKTKSKVKKNKKVEA